MKGQQRNKNDDAGGKPNINGVGKEVAARGNSNDATLTEVLVRANLVTYMGRLVVTKRKMFQRK